MARNTADAPKRVSFHRGDVESAVRAAIGLHSDVPLYATPGHGGMRIGCEKPAWGQPHYVISPDGSATYREHDPVTGRWSETQRVAATRTA